MIYSILGYDDDQKVDEVILGLMLALGSSKTVPVMFYYYKFLADSINLQLVQFSTTRSFIFKSYLLDLFLFSQVNQFASINLKLQDEVGNPLSGIHWTSIVRKQPQNAGFAEFVSRFMSIVDSVIYEESPPRMFPEMKRFEPLQPTPDENGWTSLTRSLMN